MKQLIDAINAELVRLNASSDPAVRGEPCCSYEGAGLLMFADSYCYPHVMGSEAARELLESLQALPDGAGMEVAWEEIAPWGVEAGSEDIEAMVEDHESTGVTINPAAWMAARRAR